MAVDQLVGVNGHITDALGLSNNTLIIFASDSQSTASPIASLHILWTTATEQTHRKLETDLSFAVSLSVCLSLSLSLSRARSLARSL